MSARTTELVQYKDGTVFKGIVVQPHVGARPGTPRHVVIAPYMSSRIDIGAHNNNLPNLIRALNERVFNVSTPKGLAPTPQPEKGVWRSLGDVSSRLARQVCKFDQVEPLSDAKFIEQCPANKRSLYTRAGKEYTERGWGDKDARIKAFVKFEKLNFSKKSDPAPRIIQPRSPVYNYALGRFTRRIEEEMYTALSKEWGDDDIGVVMKGRTVEEVAACLRSKWLKFSHPVAIGLDASRFDQHVSRDALKWEHSIYLKIFNYDPELQALLRKQLSNKGFAFLDGHKLTYSTSGTRASGDMNTSLGNCIIMCTLVREYIRTLGIEAEFVNNGDDCLVFIEKRDLHKLHALPEYFLKHGFEMEVEDPVYEFEHCVFCQTQPVLVDADNDRWVMVRQPTIAFAKDALCLAGNTELAYRQWAFQVGNGGYALYGDMPLFGAMYTRYRQLGVDSSVGNSLLVSDSGFMRMSRVPRCRKELVYGISDATRISFWKAFGYKPSEQIAMEGEFAALKYEGVVNHSQNIAVCCGIYSV